jgi:transcriptional regulator with XRE-family HTH domain
MPMNIVIQEQRKLLGLTQEQVADYLGVSTPAVSKWEKGVSQTKRY